MSTALRDTDAPTPEHEPPPSVTRRRWEVWKSPADQPRWARPALLGIAALAALLYTWNITTSGYAPFYAVAARSMSESWRAFFFGALDPGATLTLDKLGGFLWPQALSARVFGFHAWSLTLPQAVEGVISVLVLYRVVRLWAGVVPGLLAAGIMTLTPAVASMFGHSMGDGAMTMCLVLAADACQRAMFSARLRPLLLAGVWVGLGFQAKMLQAWLILPALAVGYLVVAPTPLRRRVGHVLAAGAVTLAVSLSWVAVLTFTPASERPYVDGTTDNSAISMVFGYNGLNRFSRDAITGSVSQMNDTVGPPQGIGAPDPAAAPGAPPDTGPSGGGSVPGKLLGSRFAPQVGWLYPLALTSLVLCAGWRRKVPRTDRLRGGYVLWGGWLAISALVLSAIEVPHTAYVAMLAPALAALSGAGLVALWKAYRDGRSVRVLPAVIAVELVWSAFLCFLYPDFLPWLPWLLILAGLVALTSLVVAHRKDRRTGRLALVGLAAGLVTMFAGPAAWSLSVLDPLYAGSAMDASAGPFATGGNAVRRAANIVGVGNAPRGTAAASASLNESDVLTDSQHNLLAYTQRHGDGAKFVFANDSAVMSWNYILATGARVLPMGGFSGGSPTPAPAEVKKLVSEGKLRFVLLSSDGWQGYAQTQGKKNAAVDEVRAWVKADCTAVPASTFGGNDKDVQGTLYRCGD
ncbi:MULTISPECIES: ArnT family glycosyltransferase [Streptomyces]|uniref:Glycosyltransferase family 39 protein n=1 Tax=Streptomyces solicathayae TaxID=3081768 RepID=A0ABZ0M2J2_9ACTN|nr:glycosyltransferase family 39 protein [Streptomyces sp. HUAS YS2]WOX25802.1 glycosyltransferase family 39 protein [Streptomyces sp. HUAS YS2]